MSGSLITAAIVALTAVPVDAAELKATFIGNAGFHLTDGTRAILVDFPYEPGAFGYMRWSPAHVPGGPRPLCLFTHAHADHFDLQRVAEHCAVIAGPADVTRRVSTPTLPLSDPIAWEGLVLRPVATLHGPVEHYSWLIEWQGLRLWVSGDTDATTGLRAVRGLDVAFVTPWLLKRLAGPGARADTRKLVVYHHREGEDIGAGPGVVVPKQGEVIVVGMTPSASELAAPSSESSAPAPRAAEAGTSDAAFTASWAEAERNMQTSAGKAWQAGPFSTRFRGFYAEAFTRCARESGVTPTSFDLALRLDATGTVRETVVSPRSKFAECFAASAAGVTFPPPPADAYWVPVPIRVR